MKSISFPIQDQKFISVHVANDPEIAFELGKCVPTYLQANCVDCKHLGKCCSLEKNQDNQIEMRLYLNVEMQQRLFKVDELHRTVLKMLSSLQRVYWYNLLIY